MRPSIRSLTCGLCLLALAACTQGGEKLDGQKIPAPSSPAGTGTVTHEPAPTGALRLAGVEFKAPAEWNDLGASQMRQATYTLGPVEGDQQEAEVTVFFFGSGQGGDIESNIRRWIGQMEAPEGKSIEEVVRRSKLTSPTGLELHFVEVDGIFQRSMGGGPMTGGRTKAFEGYRMVGAIVEAPEGNVFLKLVGPDKTARAMEEGYRAMLNAAARI